MKYSQWRIWVKNLPISQRWFVWLILLRPIIDLFYNLKKISPILSPVYLVGVLTPVLIIFSFLSRKFPQKYTSIIVDLIFGVWAVLVMFNALLLLVIKFDIDVIAEVLRFLTPVVIFYYLRHLIKSKTDIKGVLQTFIYSAIFPLLSLVYELSLGPIQEAQLSDSRGGGFRMQGGYADIMNYAIYATGAILVNAYFFLKEIETRKPRIKRVLYHSVIFVFCFAGLIAVKQSSSWAVAGGIFILFLFYSLRNRSSAFAVLLFIPIAILIGISTFETRIEPLIKKEYSVINGEVGLERSFNGRGTRWVKYYDVWSEMSFASNILGAPLSGEKDSIVMVSGFMHSDYVRLLFLCGIVGITFYFLFLIQLYKKVRYMKIPEKFLVIGSLISITLYSVTTLPLLYAPYIYYIFPIFAYAALPKTILKRNNV